MDRSAEKQYEDYARGVPLTTPERESELSLLINGDPGDAKENAILELVNGNMRLVLDLARKYRRMPDYSDTLFDGNLGLVRAAATFDSSKGRFSTWATPKIRTEIREGIYQRSSGLSALRSASEVLDRAEKNGRTNDVSIIKMAMMDSIPLYNDKGDLIDVADNDQESVPDQVHKNDLLELVHRAARELGLDEHDLTLVAESNKKDSNGEAVAEMSKRLEITKSAVRMLRAKLVWMIRKKILGYVGKDEYLILSAIGRLPGKAWR